jgi:hypothetical protein
MRHSDGYSNIQSADELFEALKVTRTSDSFKEYVLHVYPLFSQLFPCRLRALKENDYSGVD